MTHAALRSPGVADARARAMHQFWTPLWAAELLVERFFPELDATHVVLDPAAGIGNLLRGVPAHVPAIGVELDPVHAEDARRLTGREIITGDVRTIPLSLVPTHMLANPPFRVELIDAFLERAYALLPEDGRAGFLMPASVLHSARVMRYAARWSLRQELVPRELFPRLSMPLAFVLFNKSARRCLVGFALFSETAALQALTRDARQRLIANARPIWRDLVHAALRELGGEASLETIYAAVEDQRARTVKPAGRWWRDKVRQELHQTCVRTAPGRWALPVEAAA